MQDRFGLLETAQAYVGKYFSQDYVRRKILRQTDEEIIEQDKMIEKEIADGVIPDPNQPVDPETGMPMDPSMGGDPGAGGSTGGMGEVPTEPDLEQQARATKAPEMPKGGEI